MQLLLLRNLIMMMVTITMSMLELLLLMLLLTMSMLELLLLMLLLMMSMLFLSSAAAPRSKRHQQFRSFPAWCFCNKHQCTLTFSRSIGLLDARPFAR